MNDGDKKRFAVALNWLAEKMARDGEPSDLSKQQLTDYFNALKNLSIGAVETAVKNCFSNSRYRVFPLPGEIRAFVTADRSAEDMKQLPEVTSPVMHPDLLEQYHKDAANCFIFVNSDHSLDHKLEMMRAMDRAYPNLGWGEAGEQMYAHCLELQRQNTERYDRLKQLRQSALYDSV